VVPYASGLSGVQTSTAGSPAESATEPGTSAPAPSTTSTSVSSPSVTEISSGTVGETSIAPSAGETSTATGGGAAVVVGAAAVPPPPLPWQPLSRTSAVAVTSADVPLIAIPSVSCAAVIPDDWLHRPTSVHVGAVPGDDRRAPDHLAGAQEGAGIVLPCRRVQPGGTRH
jgi:hypothetical protein